MTTELIDKILVTMSDSLDEKNIGRLKTTLYMVFNDYDISKKCTDLQPMNESTLNYLKMFLIRKKAEGRSKRTLYQYGNQIKRLLVEVNKTIDEITENDLFCYLITYQMERGCSDRYIDNKRLIFSSFFTWLHNKGYISHNPAAGLDKIKYEYRIKKPFSDEELELLRTHCKDLREKALIDFLYSTGVRVSELSSINKSDVNFYEREVIVFGKGKKERKVYLTPVACMNLQKYLNSRTDDSEAVFVGVRKPYARLTKSGAEKIVRELGARAGVENAHPHRFRRTMATNAIKKGMPIEEVQALLGHAKIETTMIYCTIATENVKHSHHKFMCS